MNNPHSSFLVSDQNFTDERNSRTRKKLRTFQTDLTDAELSARNIVVTSFPDNDDRWDILFSGGVLRNIPLLHGITQPKKNHLSIVLKNKANNTKSNHFEEKWVDRFDKRIRELKESAIEEGIEFSKESRDFSREFLSDFYFDVFPSIFLSGNGNVRIVWSNKKREQIGLQFKPDGMVQYVIFKINDVDKSTHEHIMGAMKSNSIIDLIDDFALHRLASENG